MFKTMCSKERADAISDSGEDFDVGAEKKEKKRAIVLILKSNFRTSIH